MKKSLILYHRCPHCGFVSLAPAHFLPRASERERYLLHHNDESNAGYRAFLGSFLDRSFLPYVPRGGLVLDYGSGPAPMLASMIKGHGYRCDIHDPLFANTRLWRRRFYDAILLHEVIEHVKKPAKSLTFLVERTKAGGIIAIRTRFLPESLEAFPSWWYRMDPTHRSFFTPACLESFFLRKGCSLLKLEEPDIIIFRKGEIPAQAPFAD